jgi:hypothetical protein
MIHLKRALTILATTALVFGTGTVQAEKKIVHDAEHYIVADKLGLGWAKENA